jgi:hypothetical protein
MSQCEKTFDEHAKEAVETVAAFEAYSFGARELFSLFRGMIEK